MLLYLRLLIDTHRRSGTHRRNLLWENLALRQQLAVSQRQTPRPPLRQRGNHVPHIWATDHIDGPC